MCSAQERGTQTAGWARHLLHPQQPRGGVPHPPLPLRLRPLALHDAPRCRKTDPDFLSLFSPKGSALEVICINSVHLSEPRLAPSPPKHPACPWPAWLPTQLAALRALEPHHLALHCTVFTFLFERKKERRKATKQFVLRPQT